MWHSSGQAAVARWWWSPAPRYGVFAVKMPRSESPEKKEEYDPFAEGDARAKKASKSKSRSRSRSRSGSRSRSRSKRRSRSKSPPPRRRSLSPASRRAAERRRERAEREREIQQRHRGAMDRRRSRSRSRSRGRGRRSRSRSRSRERRDRRPEGRPGRRSPPVSHAVAVARLRGEASAKDDAPSAPAVARAETCPVLLRLFPSVGTHHE